MAKAKKTAQKSLIDNYDWLYWGQGTSTPFKGYISSIDPTTAGLGVMIGGSQNVYKSLLGTIRNRDGLKRRGPSDSTAAGVYSSYEWETSLGLTRVLRATNGKLQVEYDSGSGIQYYDLLTGLTADEMAALSFAPWFSESLEKDLLIFVDGKQELNMWSGGVVAIATAANTTGIIGLIRSPNYVLSAPSNLSSGGIGYVVGDILSVSGGGDARLEVDSISDASAVATVSVASGGSAYTVGDLVSISSSPIADGDCVLRVTAVSGGAVTGVAIVVAGFGYTVSAAKPTHVLQQTSGSAAGLTVNITAVGTTITSWHFTNNGSGYSIGDEVPTTGGTGTGASIAIETTLTGRATIGGTETLLQLGFPGTLTGSDGSNIQRGGTFVAGGVSYAYTALGDDGFSFLGVSPDPSPSAGLVALSLVTTTPTDPNATTAHAFETGFTNDWVNVIGNQVYVGCYVSRIVHISYNLDYLDYAVPQFRAPGNPDILILDSNSRGATAKSGQKGNAVVFGSRGDSYSIIRTQQVFTSADASTAFIYENVQIDKSTSSDLSSPIGQNFIDSIGDTIIFMDGNNQLRQYGTLRNLATPVYPFLSLDVYTELSNIDFTGGCLRAIAEQSGESVYLVSPLTGSMFIYQIRYKVDEVGNLTAERLWQPPFIVGASRVALIQGISYLYSNSNPQMYQLWDTGQYSDDSPSNEPIPYECHAIFSYISLADRAQDLKFDKLYYEGYMSRGTTLYNNIYQEYQGSKNVVTIPVNVPVNPGKKLAKFYSANNTPSLGDVALGLIPLGEGVISPWNTWSRNIPKFRAMRRTQPADMFEFASDIASYQVDCQWELLTLAVNVQSTPNKPTSIMGI